MAFLLKAFNYPKNQLFFYKYNETAFIWEFFSINATFNILQIYIYINIKCVYAYIYIYIERESKSHKYYF